MLYINDFCHFQALIKYPAKSLLEEFFYKVDDVPKWNPTVIESKLIRVTIYDI